MNLLYYVTIILSFSISYCFLIRNKNNLHVFYPNLEHLLNGSNVLRFNNSKRFEFVCSSDTDALVSQNHHEELVLKSLKDKLSKISGSNYKLEEKYIKASGPGGQKINKSAVCVQLIYSDPSGIDKIVIKCKKNRTLMLNRIEAMNLLISKIESINDMEVIMREREDHKERMRNKERSDKSKYINMINKKSRSFLKKSRSKSIPESDY